jgi:DNA-directed RNA polymerase specialized sigma24 family protein
MAREPQVTDLLRKVKSGERDAADVIVMHFWEAARREAHKHLSAAVRRFQSGSDIANAALRSALSYLQKPMSAVKDRDEFENLVLDIVRKHAKDAGRRATAEKRNVGRQQSLPEEDVVQGHARLADELAVAKELGERIEQILMEEPDKLKQAISRLGIIKHLDPPEILDALKSSPKGAPVPSLRTIQVCVKDAKDRLAAALRAEFGELRPPKKTVKKSDGASKISLGGASKTTSKKKASAQPKKARKK